ncbi:tetratricopeptide repeat protein [Acinetobacter indicus]|uniref:SEL1-like repeat protein n=1 Tax=Acinetobacter indicus TaxID=756892 RepID=UPI0035BC0621
MSQFFLDTGYQFDSLEKCLELANAGDSSAQYYIGATYCGYGFPIPSTEVNYNIAKEWYMKAAEQGHKDAQYYLGRLYHWQLKEYSKAIFWFKKSAEKGHFEAMVYLAKALQKNIKKQNIIAKYRESIFWYEKILNIKNIDLTKGEFEIEENDLYFIENIVLNLVNIYLNADDKEIRNVDKAIKILEKTGEKSLNIYMYLVNLYLNYDDPRTYNVRKAICMLEKKANLSIDAACLLGKLYAGEESKYPKEIQDFCRAETLFNNCIENYSIEAINSLCKLYKKQEKYSEAFQVLDNSYKKIEKLKNKKKKMEKLYEDGDYNLSDFEDFETFNEDSENNRNHYCELLIEIAIFYKTGLGVKVDIESSKKYLRKAKGRECYQAKILLGDFE